MARIFLDLDGVLADFDGHYETVFGERLPHRNASLHLPDPPNLWRNLGGHPSFFYDLPLLPGALDIVAAVREIQAPVILTGLPRTVPHVEVQKRSWVAENLGDDIEVLCCPSRLKYRHCAPGDVLIDDWLKYRSLWERAGGRFVLHESAPVTVDVVRSLRVTRG